MPRGRSAFGCVQRMARDVYRLRWMEDTPQGRKRLSETVYGTRREAELRMAEIHSSAGKKYGGAPTMRQCYERWWLPDAQARVSDGSLSKNSMSSFTSHWKNHVGPRWGDVPIDKIKKDEVADWITGMTSGTANTCRTVARQVVDFPVRYDVIGSNPFDVKVRMPSKSNAHNKDVYDLDTMLRALDVFKGSPIEAAVILCGFGSCRVGEALGVRREELYVVEALGVRFVAAPISRQLDRSSKEVTDRLKNKWSYRSVLLPETTGDRLLEIAGDGEGWLCDNGAGGTMTRYTVDKLWSDGLESAGIARIPFRNLRNSWHTAMVHEVGVRSETVERLMGHAINGTSGQYYDRPVVQQLAESYARAYLSNPFARS